MNLHDARAFCLPDGYEVIESPYSAVAVQAVFSACVLPCVVDESLEASLTPLASSSPLSLAGGGLVVGRREAFVASVLRPRGDRRPRPQHHVGQVTPTYPPTYLPTYVFHDVAPCCSRRVPFVCAMWQRRPRQQLLARYHRTPRPSQPTPSVSPPLTMPSQPPRCCRFRGAEQPEAHGLRQRGLARPRARGAHPRLLPPGTAPYLGPHLAPMYAPI